MRQDRTGLFLRYRLDTRNHIVLTVMTEMSLTKTNYIGSCRWSPEVICIGFFISTRRPLLAFGCSAGPNMYMGPLVSLFGRASWVRPRQPIHTKSATVSITSRRTLCRLGLWTEEGRSLNHFPEVEYAEPISAKFPPPRPHRIVLSEPPERFGSSRDAQP